MTPKEKADELHVGYWRLTNDSRIAKQCALIAVDEILEDNRTSLKLADDENLHPHARGLILGSLAIWLEVKQELENI